MSARRRVTRPALGEGERGRLRKKRAGRAIRWAAGGCADVCGAWRLSPVVARLGAARDVHPTVNTNDNRAFFCVPVGAFVNKERSSRFRKLTPPPSLSCMLLRSLARAGPARGLATVAATVAGSTYAPAPAPEARLPPSLPSNVAWGCAASRALTLFFCSVHPG